MKRQADAAGGLTGLLVCLAISVSCGDAAKQGRSPGFLVIDSLAAAPGATPEVFGTVLASDVVTNVDAQVNGKTVKVPTIFEDPGQVRMRVVLKDLGGQGSPLGPSLLNHVTITRFRVAYRRSDGRNSPGVDVPFGFDGAATATATDVGVTFGFTLVRVQAKLEAPLKALTLGGGANVISTIADVTFYGEDQAGNDASVTGSIGVNFSDWGDPAGAGS